MYDSFRNFERANTMLATLDFQNLAGLVNGVCPSVSFKLYTARTLLLHNTLEIRCSELLGQPDYVRSCASPLFQNQSRECS